MGEFIQSIRGITSRFDKTNSNTFFNHSSSAPSLFTVSLLTTTANSISKTKLVLPHFGKADSHGKKRIVMVGQQSGTLQWSIGYTTTDTGPHSDRCIQKRLGAVYRGIRTGIQWSKKGQDLHFNQLELLTIKFAILTFGKMWKMPAVHIQVNNMTALSYLLKMGRIKNPELMKLCPLIFSEICQILGKRPEIDLFASRLANQLPSYYSWKPDPNSLGTDALQQKWYPKVYMHSLHLPSFTKY